jgi:dihydrofolate synthase/folylpolyglutamate synthase
MSTVVDMWHVAALTAERAMPRERMVCALRAQVTAVEVHESVAAAYGQALAQARPGDRIVVFGSFYTVAGVLEMDL